MTNDNIQSELDRSPFRPLRFHLVSGQFIDVESPNEAYMLQHAVFVFRQPEMPDDDRERYDIIALRNIERVGQL